MKFRVILAVMMYGLSVWASGKMVEAKPQENVHEPIEHYGPLYDPFDPVDLYPDGDSHYRQSRYDKFMPNGRPAKDVTTMAENEQVEVSVELTTTDFGQLSGLVDETHAVEASTWRVAGPLDASDFNAMWEAAMHGKLRYLDLSDATFKNREVPDYAFYHPVQFETLGFLPIRKIVLPDNAERIGKAAFALTGLREINFPKSLKVIGSTAFAINNWLNCPIELPEGLQEIEHHAFAGSRWNAGLIRFPSTLRTIGEFAFALTPFSNFEVELNEGLETIGTYAFFTSCLSRVRIPDSVKNLSERAFYSSLTDTFELPVGIEIIPMGLFTDSEVVDLSLAPGIKTIEAEAFAGCSDLKRVTLPTSLEQLGKMAFYTCPMEEILLPENLNFLGEKSLCMVKLRTVYCKSPVPPTCMVETTGPFDPHVSEGILYVPIGAKEAYGNSEGWSQFGQIVETDQFPTSGINGLETVAANHDDLYDLTGRKVKCPVRNTIYIKNGKKVLY